MLDTSFAHTNGETGTTDATTYDLVVIGGGYAGGHRCAVAARHSRSASGQGGLRGMPA